MSGSLDNLIRGLDKGSRLTIEHIVTILDNELHGLDEDDLDVEDAGYESEDNSFEEQIL